MGIRIGLLILISEGLHLFLFSSLTLNDGFGGGNRRGWCERSILDEGKTDDGIRFFSSGQDSEISVPTRRPVRVSRRRTLYLRTSSVRVFRWSGGVENFESVHASGATEIKVLGRVSDFLISLNEKVDTC